MQNINNKRTKKASEFTKMKKEFFSCYFHSISSLKWQFLENFLLPQLFYYLDKILLLFVPPLILINSSLVLALFLVSKNTYCAFEKEEFRNFNKILK